MCINIGPRSLINTPTLKSMGMVGIHPVIYTYKAVLVEPFDIPVQNGILALI